MSSGIDSEQVEVVHPGSRAKTDLSVSEQCSAEAGCITCGDVALPLEVVRVDHERGLALCRDQRGGRETVETALVLPVEPGETLLVHAGTAISHLTREQPPSPPGDVVEAGSP